jgi:curved DNA-binding protein
VKYQDYYAALGVPRTASQDEIKAAYRKLARKYHPDVSKEADAEAKFKEVNEANEVLKDPEKRAAYDQLGSNWKAGQEFRAPPPGWDAGFEFRGAGREGPFGGFQGGAGMPEGFDASDFFEALFGRRGGAGMGGAGFAGGMPGGMPGARGRRAAAPRDGEDHHAKVLIDLEDSYRGAQRTLTLRMPGPDGDGSLAERRLDVQIPKGVRAGQKLRLAGQGGPAEPGGRAGDLYLEIEFKPDARFRVEGSDVSVDLPLAPWEAALGASVEVATPEGPVTLSVPRGATAGKKLRLKGRGLPSAKPGDLYAVVSIALPPADTDKAKDAYAEMAKSFDFNPRFHERG